MSNLERQVQQRLDEKAIRYTGGRRQVVNALAGADGPRSTAELHLDLDQAVPLSSLYRSLAVLEEAGIVTPHFSSQGTRYELAEWLMGHHHHLVCLNCGMVEDIEVTDSIENELLAIVSNVGSRSKFTPTDHSLEIEGVCASCA